MTKPVPLPALLLGLAGLIPPLVLTAVALLDLGLFAPSTPGFVRTYAAVILSFLGGTWWAFACKEERPRPWLLAIAVVPSLAAWWAIFTFQPVEGLIGLTILLLASLLVDALLVARGLAPRWWMRLRVPLSAGLALCCGLSAWDLLR